MALIQGRNGRTYDTATGKRIESTPHTEHRSREQLIAARAATTRKQPSGISTGNPFEKTIELELKRHNHLWQSSIEGQRVLGNLRRASAKWEANETAKQEQSAFAESLRPLVEHATNQYELVLGDETASVEDCERAAAALEAAKVGDRDSYVAWEKARHDQVTSHLAEVAADYDSQARAANEKRNAVLASALAPTPVPEVKQPEPVMEVPVDRSRVAIRRNVVTNNGSVREVTSIESV
jgi:hypothetical protein